MKNSLWSLLESTSIHVVLLLLLSTQTFDLCDAFIPASCAENLTFTGVCCPTSPHDEKLRCGGPKRGTCARADVPLEPVDKSFQDDDRLHWPVRLFKYVCICKPQFYGPACEQCWFGLTGYNCDKVAKLRVRRNLYHYSPKELELFQKVMLQSYYEPSDYVILVEPKKGNWRYDPIKAPIFETTTVHYLMNYVHRYATRGTLIKDKDKCPKNRYVDFGHNGAGFSLWHRMMMLFWQRLLEKISKKYFGVKEFAMPYWNFVDDTPCEICQDNMVCNEGQFDLDGQRLSEKCPFYHWTNHCSEEDAVGLCFGCHVSKTPGKVTRYWAYHNMPTTDDLDFVMSHHIFYSEEERKSYLGEQNCMSFQRALEGFCGPKGTDGGLFYFHNRIHTAINGSMLFRGTTVNDPLFLPAHVEVDRLLQAWMIDHKPTLNDYPTVGTRTGHCRDCNLVPFLPPVKYGELFVPTEKLGYTYDTYRFGKNGRVYGTGRIIDHYYQHGNHKESAYPPAGTIPKNKALKYGE